MRRSGKIDPGNGAGPFTGHAPRSVARIPARIADVYEMLSCDDRFPRTGTGVFDDGRVAAPAAGFGRLSGRAVDSVSGRFAVSAVTICGAVVSRALATVCGVDAVDTGGAPLLTDSGPQATAMMTANGATARPMKMRDVERSMMRGIYTSTESETRASVRVFVSVAKTNLDPPSRVAGFVDDR